MKVTFNNNIFERKKIVSEILFGAVLVLISRLWLKRAGMLDDD